ncbi:M20/M25/M40 family metallo-hydrolase [Hansschlegelia zhihuaiae]|uniref:M20/M25/M40 family metallo-hydrolase n=1 Tax=Hansschlegelia zhihuaiae TaxID=405005 RepID=A0A4Q0MLE3_9HYPH|nr:M20/M25/M40 family metallo-hydrolase [Hansschlegelia zhihuaiae]RXF74343.1 M20/M25/M40 family metallo-hydrolase [Hansschlegelia zhihuaiae]
MRNGLTIAALAMAIATAGAGAARAFEPVDSSTFVKGFGADQIMPHIEALDAIAKDNGGNRAVGTPGYRASKDYVKDRLRAVGYAVELQKLSAFQFTERTWAVMARLSPSPKDFELLDDFRTMEFSGSDDVSARLILARGIEIPPAATTSSTSGCKPKDFSRRVEGKIALIQRGGCDFVVKARNAEAAGAVGAIIFNEGQEGSQETLSGSLREPGVKIPVLGASYAVGEELYDQVKSGVSVRMRVKVSADIEKVDTTNVLADLEGEVKDRTVVVGAHLDSVAEGPGVNDNGSGTAAVLAIAERFAKRQIKPRNTVRFAFWGAEEVGLVGSTHYVDTLPAKELRKIALNLNFDMLASPNFAALVYDGDGSEGDAGPAGSDVIEKVFVDHFEQRGLPSRPTLFDGRSDYFAFIENGVPAGGLFSGAEEIKTKGQAKLFGGEAGEALDPCYHKACDDIGNVSREALEQFGPAAAHAVYTFAQTREDVRAAASAQMARADMAAAARNAPYRGPRLVR